MSHFLPPAAFAPARCPLQTGQHCQYPHQNAELLRQECTGKSHFQTAVAEAIQHGNVGGKLRMIKSRQNRAGDHGGRLCVACRRQKHKRAGLYPPNSENNAPPFGREYP